MVVIAVGPRDAAILFGFNTVFVVVIGELGKDLMSKRVRSLIAIVREPFARIYF